MTSEGEMGTDFGVLRARADVPRMVNIFCALLVRLCDTHIEEEGVVLEGYEVDLGVDDGLGPQAKETSGPSPPIC